MLDIELTRLCTTPHSHQGFVILVANPLAINFAIKNIEKTDAKSVINHSKIATES